MGILCAFIVEIDASVRQAESCASPLDMEAAAASCHHNHSPGSSGPRGLGLAHISHVAGNSRSACILQLSVLGTDGHNCCPFCEALST